MCLTDRSRWTPYDADKRWDSRVGLGWIRGLLSAGLAFLTRS